MNRDCSEVDKAEVVFGGRVDGWTDGRLCAGRGGVLASAWSTHATEGLGLGSVKGRRVQ